MIDINQITEIKDEDFIIKGIAIKKTISQFLNKDKLIEFFCEVITNSTCLDFARTKNPELYISKQRPQIEVFMNLPNAKKAYPDLVISGNDRNLVEKNRGYIVNQEFNMQYVELMENIFKKITGKKIDSNYKYFSYIDEICPNASKLKGKLYDTFKEEYDLEEYGFIFRVACGIIFPEREEDIEKNTFILIEVLT